MVFNWALHNFAAHTNTLFLGYLNVSIFRLCDRVVRRDTERISVKFLKCQSPKKKFGIFNWDRAFFMKNLKVSVAATNACRTSQNRNGRK